MTTPRTDTKTIIAAMRQLARDMEGNMVVSAAISEAADRLEELRAKLRECAECMAMDYEAYDDGKQMDIDVCERYLSAMNKAKGA